MSSPVEFVDGNDARDRRLTHTREQASPGPSARPFRGFDVERATYERLKAELLGRAEGRYVVVVGEEWAGPVRTADDAEATGYARFGIGPLYIKRLTAEEPVDEISRDITA
jgi:hypothetical protein